MTVLTAQLARELIDSQGLYVIIPEIYTSIADDAFSGKQITGIEIPESIISIGKNAFKWTQLRSVVIPSSVTHIGANAFDGSYEFRSIRIGSNVEFIGEYTFARTDNTGTGAESLAIPDSVKSIEVGAFYAMYNLKNVSIGSGITSP